MNFWLHCLKRLPCKHIIFSNLSLFRNNLVKLLSIRLEKLKPSDAKKHYFTHHKIHYEIIYFILNIMHKCCTWKNVQISKILVERTMLVNIASWPVYTIQVTPLRIDLSNYDSDWYLKVMHVTGYLVNIIVLQMIFYLIIESILWKKK